MDELFRSLRGSSNTTPPSTREVVETRGWRAGANVQCVLVVGSTGPAASFRNLAGGRDDHGLRRDIHGQADKLEALLPTLGYRHTAGAWRDRCVTNQVLEARM